MGEYRVPEFTPWSSARARGGHPLARFDPCAIIPWQQHMPAPTQAIALVPTGATRQGTLVEAWA